MQTLKYTGLQPLNITYKTRDVQGFTKRIVLLAKGDTDSFDETSPIIKSLIDRGLLVNATDAVSVPAVSEKNITKNLKK